MSTRSLPTELAEKLANALSDAAMSFGEIRMADIAAATGVSRTTLYYYFASKDDVLAFLIRSMLDDLGTSVEAALAVEGDAFTRLRAVVRAQLDHLAANPATSQLLLMNLGRTGQVAQIASGIDAGFDAPVRQVLRDGVAAGELGELDVELTATAIYASVTIVGLRSLVLTGGIDVSEVADRLFSMLLVRDRCATRACKTPAVSSATLWGPFVAGAAVRACEHRAGISLASG